MHGFGRTRQDRVRSDGSRLALDSGAVGRVNVLEVGGAEGRRLQGGDDLDRLDRVLLNDEQRRIDEETFTLIPRASHLGHDLVRLRYYQC